MSIESICDPIEAELYCPTWKPMVYLSCPLGVTKDDLATVSHRIKTAEAVEYELRRRGIHVYNPLAIVKAGDTRGATIEEYWRDYSLNMLSRCDMLVVLTLEGWQQSVGVTAEIRLGEDSGIPVMLTDSKLTGVVERLHEFDETGR